MKIYRTSLEHDTERASRQAAEWLLALKTEPTAQEREEFVSWMRDSQLNLREMLVAGAVEQTLAKPGLLDEFDLDAVIAEAKLTDNVVPLQTAASHPPPPTARTPRRTSRWKGFAMAASVLMAVGIGWTAMRMNANAGQTFATGIGEEKVVHLEDGSTLQLHPRAQVRVNFSKGNRDIELASGEAEFEVAHDTTRPFRVYAGTSMVQAVGTHFSVNLRPSGTFVAVTEGKVKVSAETPSPIKDGVKTWFSAILVTAPQPVPRPDTVVESLSSPVPLVAGQTARIATNANVMQRAPLEVATVDPKRAARRLVFHDDTLADIAESFNRYNVRQIEIPEGTMRDQRYSGVFDATDPDSFLQFLSCCTTLKVEVAGNRVVVKNQP